MINLLAAVLIASIGWGICPIFEKKALEKISPVIGVTLFGLFFGLFALIILTGLYFKNNRLLSNGIGDLYSIKYLFLSAFFAYVLGSVFFFIALSKGKNTSITILLAYVLPILISIFLAKMVFNDRINKMMALGMAITMVGLVMTVYYKEK